MPELPEVETIRRGLAPRVEGRTLAEVEILDPRWTRPRAPAEVQAALTGRRVHRLARRGKYLVWELDGEAFLLQHLRMTGAILYDPADPDGSSQVGTGTAGMFLFGVVLLLVFGIPVMAGGVLAAVLAVFFAFA